MVTVNCFGGIKPNLMENVSVSFEKTHSIHQE